MDTSVKPLISESFLAELKTGIRVVQQQTFLPQGYYVDYKSYALWWELQIPSSGGCWNVFFCNTYIIN